MNVEEGYNVWAAQYDTDQNKTRDLEAVALREVLARIESKECLEVGCGTGKNTAFLITRAKHVTAIDLSANMLAKAREKVKAESVIFQQFDILRPWTFTQNFDLVTFSLILEHIEDLGNVFEKVAGVVEPGGYVYIGELHPFKQYTGSKARFKTDGGTQSVICFNHNVSDFTQAAKRFNFEIVDIREYFDGDDKNSLPRVLTMLLRNRA